MSAPAHADERARRDPLQRLAAAAGIELSFRDAAGADCAASPEALRAVLQAMGAPLASEGAAEAALSAHEAAEAERPCERVVVAWEGRLPEIEVRAVRSSAPVVRAATLELEEGGAIEDLSVRALGPGARDARDGPAQTASIAIDLRDALPFGVHRLRLDLAGGATAALHVLAAPTRCWEGESERAPATAMGERTIRRETSDRDGGRARARLLGLFAPVHALRSHKSPGTLPGNLVDLARLRDWALPLGIDVIGVLPLLASYLDEPFDPSPYAPVSRLFWSEVYLDLSAAPLPGAGAAPPGARAHAVDDRDADPPGAASNLVDYRTAMRSHRRALEAIAEAAFSSSTLRDEIERFARAEPNLEPYARFRATAERQRAGWPAWPAAARRGELTPGDFDEASRRYHLYAQWLWDRQFREQFGAGEALYLDLPIGVHGGGFDVWRFREQFAVEASVGAPPDLFFAAGQDWGFPPPHPRHGRDTGHAYFRSVVRAHLRRAGMLRLDHVMALHRLFWIPRGATARDGVYVRYPADELYAILAIESHRHRARIVGENLGTVPREVDEGLRRHGLLPMRIVQFEVAPDWPRHRPAPAGLAALNTHDTATFAAFWEGRDVALRLRLGLLDDAGADAERARRREIRVAVVAALESEGWLPATSTPGDPADALDRAAGRSDRSSQRDVPEPSQPSTGEVLRALLRRLAASGADVVMVQLEDLWLEPEPQNVPGIGGEFPSWRRRMSRSLEAIEADRSIAALLRELAALRQELRAGS